jgi:methylenetetrahydrofolate dehydrogenase (NADP+)/methenyltetrahydrofolate cyclohydrolase
MVILDGKKTSEDIRIEIKAEVDSIRKKGKKIPHLAAVLVGNVGASVTYVNAKIKDCEEVGFVSSLVRLSDTVSERELLEEIEKLNNDDEVDGFIVQLPLPSHIDEKKIILAIKPEKDVDGFHPENIGKMALNFPGFLPATPYGILQLLQRYNVDTTGKHCVVVGRSNIVGSPMSILMARNSYPGNCTVTLTHSRTVNFKEICRQADILIVALGKPEYIKADMVKEGVVIVDVGITRLPDTSKKSGYRIVGDVDFNSVASKCTFLTPVPVVLDL